MPKGLKEPAAAPRGQTDARIEPQRIITVRLPASAHDAAKEAAWRKKQSLNSWCIDAICRRLPPEPPEQPTEDAGHDEASEDPDEPHTEPPHPEPVDELPAETNDQTTPEPPPRMSPPGCARPWG